MNYLLDVNVLVAWGWSDHVDHERTAAWIGAARRQKATKLMTSAIPELGFVRVSVQRAGGHVTVAEATETLAGMVTALGARPLRLRRSSHRAYRSAVEIGDNLPPLDKRFRAQPRCSTSEPQE